MANHNVICASRFERIRNGGNMFRLKILYFVLLFIPVLASAAFINKSAELLLDAELTGEMNGFGARLIFVGNEDELFSRWGEDAEMVEIGTIDTVRQNGVLNIFVVFSGCAKDDSGNCNVVMSFKVLRPDGSVYAQTPAMDVWYNRPAPPNKVVELSMQYLKLVIEPTEPLGRYMIHAKIRDNNSGGVLQLNGPFTAVAGIR